MSTSHAWINTGNVCWFQVFICSTDFCEFYINSFFLLCFRKIIFPSESLRTGIATGVWHKGMLAYYEVITLIFAFLTVMLAMRVMIDGVTV